jgi:hypothetical protein
MQRQTLLPRRCRLALLGLACAASLTARADYPATILADSPSGYWRLGELPTTYADPNGTVTNSGSLGTAADGVFGGFVNREVPGALVGSADTAFGFVAANVSRVTMGSPSSFNFTGTRSFTLETWAKPTIAPTGSQRLIANGSAGQGYAFCFQDNNRLRITAFGLVDVSSDLAPAPWATNQWYHLVLVRSNTLVYFYTNGVQFGSPKTMNSINTTANPLTLGRTAAGAEPFTGLMDETAVYTNVLTAAQVAAHYANGLANGAGYAEVIIADGPIGYWRLNQPKKPQESATVIANTGSVGAAGNGQVFGSLNSVVGGSASPLVGDANPAMGFNGTDGKIEVSYNVGLNPASFTVECWAKVDAWANTHQSPLTSRNTGSRGYIFYAAPATASAPRWEFWTGSGAAFGAASGTAPDVVLGQWAHLVGTYDAATQLKLLYVDGQLVGGGINVSVLTNDAAPLRIGAGATESVFGNFFVNGGVDEVAVYPSVLGGQRVLAHYEAAKGVSPAVMFAPGVSVNPINQTNWAPYPVIVSCVVTGSLPMQLQWYHTSADGSTTTAVAGGTNLVLALNPTAATDTGNYYLAATNALGDTLSLPAWIEITAPTPPAFTLDLPASIPVYVGGTAGLDTLASGTPPISYLLQSNSVTIAVSTNGVFKLLNVQLAQASVNYRVLATNRFGATPTTTCNLQVLTAPASTCAAVITNLNPTGYWRLGEDSGSTAFDYWGGLNGDYVNAYPNPPPGALLDDDDGCVQEYGAGSYVRMRDAKAFNYVGTTNKFSLAAWIKGDAWPSTGVRIFSNRLLVGNTGGYGFGVWNGNSFRFTAFGVTDVAQGLTTLNLGQWYHIAAVCSNQTVYFYLNGVYQGAGNGNIGATGIKTSPWPLQLGGSPNFAAASDEEPFTGLIDEAAVFSRLLTAAEIKAIYDSRYGSLVPPTFVREPASVQLLTGGTARFSVEATGSSPLAYQWKSNGVALAGATTTALVIPSVTAGMSGVNYTVTVTNRAGVATSGNASVTVTTPTGYAAAVVQDNPAGLWRLAEAPGSSTVYDTWGSHNGTPSGNVTFGSPGALASDASTAATFDGTSPTKVEVPYAPELNGTNFTVECWARVTGGANTYRAPVSARNEVQGGNQGGYILYATAANVWSFWTSVGAGWQGLDGSAVVPNEWTHLAATYDGVSKRLYVNGALVATEAATAVPNPLRPLRIGAGRNELDPGEYFFFGDVDEVAVYGQALPADRVAYHYGLGKFSTTTRPFITQEPVAQTIVVGGTATFSVGAAGSPLLSYQWWQGGSPLAGATQSSLVITNAAYSDNAALSAAISNGLGTTNSQAVQLTVMPPPRFANLTNSLVLHLQFEDNTMDISGRGNNGTAIGSITYVGGAIGTKALHYSTDTTAGLYNYVTLGTPADLTFSTNVNFSVAYWVRFTGTPGDLPFLCTAPVSWSNPGITFAPGYKNGTWSYWLQGTAGPGVGLYGPALINDGTWHSLVHTFDRAGSGLTYLDGVLVDTRSIAPVLDLDNFQPMNIGQDPTGAYAEDGSADIDDVGIWRRVLNQYEAESIYAVGHGYGSSFNTYGPVRPLVQQTGGNVEIIWQAGTLEQNSDVNNPVGWTPVPGAVAPYYKVTSPAAQKFYRVKQ